MISYEIAYETFCGFKIKIALPTPSRWIKDIELVQVTGLVTHTWSMFISFLLEKHLEYQSACCKVSCLIYQKITAAESLRTKSREGRLVACGHALGSIKINPLSFEEFSKSTSDTNMPEGGP